MLKGTATTVGTVRKNSKMRMNAAIKVQNCVIKLAQPKPQPSPSLLYFFAKMCAPFEPLKGLQFQFTAHIPQLLICSFQCPPSPLAVMATGRGRKSLSRLMPTLHKRTFIFSTEFAAKTTCGTSFDNRNEFQATSGLSWMRQCCICLKTVVPAAINVNNRVTFLPTQIVGQQIMFVDTLIQVIMYIYINHFQTMYCKEIFLMMLLFCPLFVCCVFEFFTKRPLSEINFTRAFQVFVLIVTWDKQRQFSMRFLQSVFSNMDQ